MIPDVDPVRSATTTATEPNTNTTTAMDMVVSVEAAAAAAEETSTDSLTNSPTPATNRTTSMNAATAVTPYHHSRPNTSTITPMTLVSSSSTTTAMIKKKEEPVVTTPLLSLYYQHLFPYDFLHQWFRYGTGTSNNRSNNSTAMNLFYHREFSFTIQNSHTDDEIYLRYQSFSNLNDFQSAIQKRLPIKIDIGAIFSHPPVQKHSFASNTLSSFQPIEREFVLDIDLTDYDDVRNCGCHSANICPICWKYMYMAIETINTALHDDFQFQHIQWFYSGRRGIHGWVCDDAAKTLTDHGRTAIANYLTVRGNYILIYIYIYISTCSYSSLSLCTVSSRSSPPHIILFVLKGHFRDWKESRRSFIISAASVHKSCLRHIGTILYTGCDCGQETWRTWLIVQWRAIHESLELVTRLRDSGTGKFAW